MSVLPLIKAPGGVQGNRAAFVLYSVRFGWWLVHIGCGLIAISGFLVQNPKVQAWIFGAAISVSVGRLILLMVDPDAMAVPAAAIDFAIKFAGPAIVLLVGFRCVGAALRQRFTRVA